MPDLYAVLLDMGLHPETYSIATVGEIRAFMDGYRFALSRGIVTSPEVPPFRQFSEWLVRKLDRGNTSMGWWEILKWDETDEAMAIRHFATLIAEFSQRYPTVLAIANLDVERHRPTRQFQYGFAKNGVYTDMTDKGPFAVRITHYALDEGVYLEYCYEDIEYERYSDSYLSAQMLANRDFCIEVADWIVQVKAPWFE
ncbi:hypothetical protein VN12_22755 [Pirellula sp. SH-Sr6A]|uniref:hypothetical protein n=1 Tax=Pirellula sp. SH-Sr6A TaxID=1632865 RepID=UPI00078D58EE|nr:hypothetical protein [Pirellula sp. SH-Sr6A]AMV34965.1 hypothetical protein VN12_22755 [Pirellula sp. SH-Sr6A]